MSDASWDGRRFRTFNVIDDFNREAFAAQIDTGISARRVIRILDQIAAWRGLSTCLRFDNGLEDVRLQTEKWLDVYNRHRPHDSLGNLTPMEYLQKFSPETVI